MLTSSKASRMESKQIAQVIAKIKNGEQFSASEQSEVEHLLVEHECWKPLFKLLDRGLTGKIRSDLHVHQSKLKIEVEYLSNWQAALQRVQEIVSRLGVDFDFFRLEILQQIVENNWQKQADILMAVHDKFQHLSDKIKCLERICFIYEKKIPNEELLRKFYLTLNKLDNKNIKAMKYFKMLHSQNFEWDKVIGLLKKIMANGNTSEVYRSAQELATVYLYSKNLPQRSLEVLNKYCADSPLDKFAILYDIYTRLNDWKSCITLLRAKLASSRSPIAQSKLHFKIGNLLERLADWQGAVEEYKQAFNKDMNFISALEKMIDIYAREGNWEDVLVCLQELQDKVSERSKHLRIEKLINDIKRNIA